MSREVVPGGGESQTVLNQTLPEAPKLWNVGMGWMIKHSDVLTNQKFEVVTSAIQTA